MKKNTVCHSERSEESQGLNGILPACRQAGGWRLRMTTSVLVLLCLVSSCGGSKKVAGSLKEVSTTTVTRGTIDKASMFTGNIVAEAAFDVFPRATGKVSQKLLKEGDPVKRNQPILLVERDEVGFRFRPMPVVSLVDGYVGSIMVDVGADVNPQVPVVTVVKPGKMRVKLDVPERYLNVILPGTAVKMIVDTLGGETFDGNIVTSSPVVAEKTRTANVEVELPNTDGRLRHGMFGRMNIVVDKKADTLTADLKAISWEGEKRFVYKVADGKLVRTEVRTGLRNDNTVEILDGAVEGDTLVVGDLLGLKDGETVIANNQI